MLVKVAYKGDAKSKAGKPVVEYNEGNWLRTGFGDGGYSTEYNKDTEKFTINKMPLNFMNKLMSPIHSIWHGDKVSKEIADIADKHEKNEALYGSYHPFTAKAFIESGGTKGGMFADHVGAHYSLGLLGHEANDVLKTSDQTKEWFTKLRHFTGERKLLHDITGKVYGYDTFTDSDIKKLENHKALRTQQVDDGLGTTHELHWHKTKAPGPNYKATGALGAALGLGFAGYAMYRAAKSGEKPSTIARIGEALMEMPNASGILAPMAIGAMAAAKSADIAYSPYKALWRSSPTDFINARKIRRDINRVDKGH